MIYFNKSNKINNIRLKCNYNDIKSKSFIKKIKIKPSQQKFK